MAPFLQALTRWLPALAICLLQASAATAEVKILLPVGRTGYQTNEWIDLAVVRQSDKALAASTLELSLKGADGSAISASFPAAAVPLQNKAVATEHLHLNGWLLRPGKYTLGARVDGETATTPLEIHSHLRQSSFRLINWGRANGKDQLYQGEDSLGFNLFYGAYGQDDTDSFLRAGVDFMPNCVMTGGHQMDLRMECDWSDPYVTRGGTRRVVRRAMIDRTRPNVPGIHFYDEPGLTWMPTPGGKDLTPHGIPAQVRSYTAAFGKPPIKPEEVDLKKPETVARWRQWAYWKLGFMDAAWREAQFGVSQVRPDFLSVTQSQYGFSAYTDGYYFNVVRSLPVISGHGGYHDFGPGFFNPSYFLEMARARDFGKPCWYLPTWYGNTTQRSVPPGAVPVVPDWYPGHDVAARPGAGHERHRPAGHRRIQSPDEEARADLHHHAGQPAAGRHALFAVSNDPQPSEGSQGQLSPRARPGQELATDLPRRQVDPAAIPRGPG